MLYTLALALSLAGPLAAAAPTSSAETTMALDALSLTQLDGTPMPKATLDGKVVLFVNVASRCGHTPQYDGLQKLYDAKKDDGLVIVGVPCNQFGGQEPGSSTEIASFCKMNYGVEFPLLEKQKVNGGERSDLYSFLVNSAAGGGNKISWNFEKFLVGRDGAVLQRFKPGTQPDDAGLVAAIDAALKQPGT